MVSFRTDRNVVSWFVDDATTMFVRGYICDVANVAMTSRVV